METSWEKLADELIREIAVEIEKDRQRPPTPFRPENPAADPGGLPLPTKSRLEVKRT